MAVSAQFHAPVALLPGKEPPWYPLNRKLDGPEKWSGHFGEDETCIPAVT